MAPKFALNFQALHYESGSPGTTCSPAGAALRAELSDLRFEHFYLHRGLGWMLRGTQGLSKVNLVKVFSF